VSMERREPRKGRISTHVGGETGHRVFGSRIRGKEHPWSGFSPASSGVSKKKKKKKKEQKKEKKKKNHSRGQRGSKGKKMTRQGSIKQQWESPP